MKGLILALLIGMPVFVYGQEHLRFLDHPITGDLKEFVKKLNAEGYESVSNKYRFQGMQTKTVRGTFWKFSDSYVIVRKFKRSPDVSSVYIHPKNGYVLLNEYPKRYRLFYFRCPESRKLLACILHFVLCRTV